MSISYTYNTSNTSAAGGGSWVSPNQSTSLPYQGTPSFMINTQTIPDIDARIDALEEKLELMTAAIEKLLIEARYWHIRSNELEKRLADESA